MNLNLLELYFQGNSYGHVLTEANPTADGGRLFRVEVAELENLAQLAADVMGFEQHYLPPLRRGQSGAVAGALWLRGLGSAEIYSGGGQGAYLAAKGGV